ncbi:MAG: helix-turn-helix domain-containing protein, partial [Phototrophicaceae bacterium]
RIERGDNSPTVASLQLIAGALGVSITDFFVAQPEQAVVYVTPAERDRSADGVTLVESLGTGLRNQQLEPFLVTVLPGSPPRSPITHAGQEFVYCLSGSVNYQINETVYEMQAGHSLLFEAMHPHRFWNPKTTPAQLIFVFQAAAGYQHHLRK